MSRLCIRSLFFFCFRFSWSLSYFSVSCVSVVFSFCVFVFSISLVILVSALVLSACFGYQLTRFVSVLNVIVESILSSFTNRVFGAASEARFGSCWIQFGGRVEDTIPPKRLFLHPQPLKLPFERGSRVKSMQNRSRTLREHSLI